MLVAAPEQGQLDRKTLRKRRERSTAARRHVAGDEEHRLHGMTSV
jgi:hypothetical protein